MNEKMKRLIQVLNDAGYEVIEIADQENCGVPGIFRLKIDARPPEDRHVL